MMQQQTEEPWVPAGLAEKLVVGTRVRTRMTGECVQEWPEDSLDGMIGLRGHHPEENGVLAVIIKYGPQECPTHPYEIRFAHPVYFSALGRLVARTWCAAVELEPLAEGGEA